MRQSALTALRTKCGIPRGFPGPTRLNPPYWPSWYQGAGDQLLLPRFSMVYTFVRAVQQLPRLRPRRFGMAVKHVGADQRAPPWSSYPQHRLSFIPNDAVGNRRSDRARKSLNPRMLCHQISNACKSVACAYRARGGRKTQFGRSGSKTVQDARRRAKSGYPPAVGPGVLATAAASAQAYQTQQMGRFYSAC